MLLLPLCYRRLLVLVDYFALTSVTAAVHLEALNLEQQSQPLLGFTGGILIESTLRLLLSLPTGARQRADIVAAHSLTLAECPVCVC